MKVPQFCGHTRREFLWQTGAGFASVALTALLDKDGFFSTKAVAETIKQHQQSTDLNNPLAVKPPHIPNRAKACIFLFLYGGPSSMDMFDYKPELQKRDGQTVKLETRRGAFTEQKLLGSKRTFTRNGKSGLWCSDALPHTAKIMDDVAVINSLYSDSFAHGSAMLQMNCGRILQGHPSLGSWLGYGLGSANGNLPGYVVMLDPRGGPISGASNWASGYMPAAYQGTVFRSAGQPILNLSPAGGVTSAMQRDQIDTINSLNAAHLESHPGYSELQARIASYELAFQLQSTAPDALDITKEDEHTREMYGLNDPKGDHALSLGPAPFGKQCLIARRLVERGVRFVQIYSGGGHQQQNWDAHNGIEENLRIHCPEIDKPFAALITDLKQRGLLEETLVILGGEFGRQPVSQGSAGGRDHNPKGFSYVLAGAGVKKGVAYGETDEFGHEAVTNRHHVRDLHATILNVMGLDHQKLSYFYGGLDQKLVGVLPTEIIKGILS